MTSLRTTALAWSALVVLAGCGDSGTGTESEPDPPSLSVGATTVTLTAAVVGDPVSGTVAITNGGDGVLRGLSVSVSYEAGGPEGWLTAGLSGTTAPATLTLEARPLPLSGTYTATVVVAASSTGTTHSIEVSLDLAPVPYLYLIDHDTDVLRRMDPATLEITDVGALGVAFRFGDCAWDSDERTLYMVDGREARALYTVDLATGAATLVGNHGVRDMFALEYHPPSATLYAASGGSPPQEFFRLDAGTGAATRIGELEYAVHALAWDSTREVMMAVRASNASALLMTIDLASAALTIIDGTVAVDNHGLAYDPGRDVLWAADVVGLLARFDPADGYAATELATGVGAHTCLAYVPG